METDRPIWRSRAWVVAVVVLLGTLGLLGVFGVEDGVSVRVTLAVAMAVVGTVVGWAVLRTRAQRRGYETELAAWSAERATQAERLRIARDLHDLASHGLGLITLRAAAARRAAGPGVERERQEALADIERVGREATTELRRMLTLLRTPGPAPLQPAETLAELPAIVRTATDAGLEVNLELGELGGVSAGAQLTICRIVREGLNNALRHAGPTRVRVVVRRDGDALVVRVRDAGAVPGWRPHPGASHGLDGLRERLAALDGALLAAPVDDGWLLAARIPDRTAA